MEQVVDWLTGKELAMGIAMRITVARRPLDLSAFCRAAIKDAEGLILELRQWKEQKHARGQNCLGEGILPPGCLSGTA